MAQVPLQAIKQELERAFLKERDSSKWTIERYDELSGLLDKALDNGLGEPRDKHGIGAATLVQAALNACNAFEKAQIKTQLSQSPGADYVRACNGKTVIIEECSRILSGLNCLSQQSWNDAIAAPELNGPIFQNSRIETMAFDVRKAFRRIDRDVRRVDEGLRMVGDVVSQYDCLVQRVESEVASREHLEVDARNNMDRTKSQTTAAIAHGMDRIATSDMRKCSLMNAVATRATAIEMVDLQHILAEQMQHASEGRLGNDDLAMPTNGDDEQFAQSLFAGPDDGTEATALSTMTRLRAKRSQRQLEQRLASVKHLEGLQTQGSVTTEAERVRLDDMRKAREAVDEGVDDTDAEKSQRADARKFLMKYTGDVWRAVAEGDLDVVQKFFLVDSTAKLLNMHNKEPGQGRRTLLHAAAWRGQESIVEYLLHLGAEVDAIDTIHSKSTALIEAARAGHRGVCKLLLDHGACLTHQDAHNYQGFTCLDVTKTSYLTELVKRTFNITPISSRDQRRQAKRLGLKKMQRASLRMVMPSSAAGSSAYPQVDDLFDSVVQAKAQVLDGLNTLGLGLETFAYTR
ncbi:hypothetical protein DYB37_005129 [Aphanomyces astaci]|uniref:Uncharacterized protein n=2 Tax=Aphanomyces astaci TaxID=112090 RepID=A0A397AX49_APHAT|nr:hypothetical protein DYB36_006151 [Aphanomyces astaci]RHY89888.1 hypothetical protein DYB35_000266 [Aphanomyces astaci]RHZ27975.1 hypothetical protein DYB37_005129 [Aphanomyces astaci]